MAVTTHYEIYRSYTPQELEDERKELIKQRRGYQSQSAGGKSYQQDLSRIDEMLQALVRVQGERGRSDTNRSSRATADFSNYGPSV
jgi:hypothetical protein